ncbi:MAG: hypothetical protein IJ713_07730 [Oscillibacter sp.]|nr:hypothetical protein [Oscillibacter sp.]
MVVKFDKRSWRDDAAVRFDAETNHKARISSALGYLFFFVPLTMHPESKFARYHANQGLLLLLLMTLGLVLAAMVPYFGPLLLLPVAAFGVFCGLRGVIVALRCEAKRMPLIGKPILIEYEQVYTLET